MVLSLLGYSMLIGMMYLLLKGKAAPIVVFLILPLVVAFFICLGVDLEAFYKYKDVSPFIAKILAIAEFVEKGVGKTTANAVLFSFSVPFFGIMNNLGVFDGVVNALVKKAGKNILLILLATAVIAMISHIDGSAASTVLITVPAMLPIYKKMKIRPELLMLIVAGGVGFMNLVPWGGPTARVAVVTGISGNIIWRDLIPVQLICVASLIVVSIILAAKEKAYIALKGFDNLNYDNYGSGQASKTTQDAAASLSKKQINFNILLTICIIAMLIWGKLPLYLPFMIGTGLALLVNYKGLKAQEAAIKEQAPSTILIVVTMLASGVFVGVFEGTGMLNEMSKALLAVIPGFMSKYLHLIMGAISFPVGMVLGTDTFFYGLYPLVAQVGNNYGISTLVMGETMLVGKNLAVLASPLVPPTFLMVALTGVELKDHIKFAFPWLFFMTLTSIFAAVLLGVIPLSGSTIPL